MKTGKCQDRYRRGGFLLLEVILALAVFSISATAFAVALARTADAAAFAQRRMQVTRILDSALTQAMSWPVMEEGVISQTLTEEIGGEAVEVDTLVELIENLESEKGRSLQQMYRIRVSAHWYENGDWQEESAETWRYQPLYQP